MDHFTDHISHNVKIMERERQNGDKEIYFFCETCGQEIYDEGWAFPKIKVPLRPDNKYFLTAEAGRSIGYPEIFIGIEDDEGVWIQDLAVAGGEYEYDDTLKVTRKDTVYVNVYADAGREDYTNSFTGIGIYEMEEEE